MVIPLPLPLPTPLHRNSLNEKKIDNFGSIRHGIDVDDGTSQQR